MAKTKWNMLEGGTVNDGDAVISEEKDTTMWLDRKLGKEGPLKFAKF